MRFASSLYKASIVSACAILYSSVSDYAAVSLGEGVNKELSYIYLPTAGYIDINGCHSDTKKAAVKSSVLLKKSVLYADRGKENDNVGMDDGNL